MKPYCELTDQCENANMWVVHSIHNNLRILCIRVDSLSLDVPCRRGIIQQGVVWVGTVLLTSTRFVHALVSSYVASPGTRAGYRKSFSSSPSSPIGQQTQEYEYRLKASCIIDAPASVVFQVLMNLSPSRRKWDVCFKEAHIVETLDLSKERGMDGKAQGLFNHSHDANTNTHLKIMDDMVCDIVHLKTNPLIPVEDMKDLPMLPKARDFSLLRHASVEYTVMKCQREDGTDNAITKSLEHGSGVSSHPVQSSKSGVISKKFVNAYSITEVSVDHERIPVSTAYVRAHCNGGGWLIEQRVQSSGHVHADANMNVHLTPTTSMPPMEPVCKVTYISDIHLGGVFGSMLSPHAHKLLLSRLWCSARVSGLAEYIRCALLIDPRRDLTLTNLIDKVKNTQIVNRVSSGSDSPMTTVLSSDHPSTIAPFLLKSSSTESILIKVPSESADWTGEEENQLRMESDANRKPEKESVQVREQHAQQERGRERGREKEKEKERQREEEIKEQMQAKQIEYEKMQRQQTEDQEQQPPQPPQQIVKQVNAEDEQEVVGGQILESSEGPNIVEDYMITKEKEKEAAMEHKAFDMASIEQGDQDLEGLSEEMILKMAEADREKVVVPPEVIPNGEADRYEGEMDDGEGLAGDLANEAMGEAEEEEEEEEEEVVITDVESLLQKWDPADTTEYGMKHVIRGKYGGLEYTNKEELARQKGVATYLMKEMGSNLLKFKSLINVSLPVKIFEPRSFLQRMTDVWCFAPIYLTKAALAPGAVERMKYVVTFLISGLHRGGKQLKPFNPILGETYQGVMAGNTHVYCEQVSHHPPISSFQVIGPKRLFQYHGTHEYKASFTGNGVTGHQEGTNCITFLDGSTVEFNMPRVSIKGVLYGPRTAHWTGSIEFRDVQNGVGCDLELNPDGIKGITSWFRSQPSPLDTIKGTLFSFSHGDDREEYRNTISNVRGSWIEELRFDDEVTWKLKQFYPLTCKNVPRHLAIPSDCRFRDDLSYLLTGDMSNAQRFKEVLEQRQRDDRALRKKYKEERLAPKLKPKKNRSRIMG